MTGPAAQGPPFDPDRRVIRRALRAGLLVLVVLGVLLVGGVAAAGGSGQAGAIAFFTAFTLALLTSAGWLVASVLADLAAGARPNRRRLLWTLALSAIAFVAPVLVVGAASA